MHDIESLIEIIKYNNSLLKDPKQKVSVAEAYGKENFCYFIYSLIKMQKPKTVLELGTGFGTTALMIAQALKENKKGKIITIDNGKDWIKIKNLINTNFLTHKDFFNYLINKFKLNDFIQLKNTTLSLDKKFKFNKKIDFLFDDAINNDSLGCINVLKTYLPMMNYSSSIFIDRASTLFDSYLLLEKIIYQLNKGKIPTTISNNMTLKKQKLLYDFINKSKFTLVHLKEDIDTKINKLQDSTAWIKIEPND